MTGKTADAPEVQSAIRNHPAFKHKGGKNERSNWELAFIDQIVLESLSEYLKEYLNKNTNLNGKSSCDVILAESSQAKDRRIAKEQPRGHWGTHSIRRWGRIRTIFMNDGRETTRESESQFSQPCVPI